MRRLSSQDEHYEANVWPAVTDSILLIASIFIVLSVVSMLTMAKKFHDYQFEKSGSEGTVCLTWAVNEEHLFKVGKSTLKNETNAKTELKSILKKMADLREDLLPEAIKEWGEGNFYIVMEVAGHTDEQGDRDLNWKLSTNRAVTVIQLAEKLLREDTDLKKRLALDDDALAQPGSTIIRAAGYCYSVPYQPVFDESGKKLPKDKLEEARQANRRVEIRLFAQPIPLVHRRVVVQK
jgi:outer membrane protein OmpA-like peptidoglycan-associated protein